MSVQANLFVGGGHDSGIAHQFYTDRKGRAWSEGDAGHTMGALIMRGIDNPQIIFQNIVFFFGQAVRGQAALALANAHRPSGGGKADAHILSRFDGVIQAAAIRIKIKVV